MKLSYSVSLLIILFFANRGHSQEVSLSQVVTLALEKNYDIRIAKKVSESADKNDSYATAALLPTVVGTASMAKTNNNLQEIRFQEASRNAKGEVAFNNVVASVQGSLVLFDGTRMFATMKRAGQIAEQSEFLEKNQMVNTIAQVINNYYDIVRQKQQLRAIHEQMAVSEERVKLAQKKLDVGTGVKPELLQAKVDMNAQRAQIIQQQTTISQLKQQLNALTGLQLPGGFDVADTILIDLNLDQDSTFESIQKTNYQLLASRKNLDISSLALREQRADYFPVLTLNGAYTFLNKTENTKQINPFGPIYNSTTNGLNYGLTLNVPILGGFNTRRLTQQAKIEFDRQSLLYEQTRVTVNVALQNALVNYSNAKEILLIEEETIGAAKENVFIALETFKRGVTTAIELRTAQQSLAEAYTRLITARFNAKVAETELLRLNGSLLK